MSLQEELRDWLERHGYTVEHVAKLLDVSTSTVYRWLNGESPSNQNMEHLRNLGFIYPRLTNRARPRNSRRVSVRKRPIHKLRKSDFVDGYQLLKRLGRGASADVWSAVVVEAPSGTDLEEDDRVAIKIYQPSVLALGSALRIQREFLVASDLQHHNLVRVHDVVISPSRPFNTFLVMDLVEGVTLKSRIKKGRVPVQDVLQYGIQIFDALDALHSAGAIHRDVKAANIIVQPNKRLVLMDFGIVVVEEDGFQTLGSIFLGSKHSAPLEQLLGHEIDLRADIYAAGTVLYHCLARKPIYSGIGTASAIALKMTQKPETLKNPPIRNRMYSQLYALVNKCLSVDPDRRPKTAEECSTELRRLYSLLPS